MSELRRQNGPVDFCPDVQVWMMAKEKRKYEVEIEDRITNQVVSIEYETGLSNKSLENDDTERVMSMFDSYRREKNYDWQADIHIPEFLSQVLTQAAGDAAQMFVDRRFVTAFLDDPSEKAKMASSASEECINRTLNRRDLYYYPKYMRAKTFNNVVGRCYIACWWEKEYETFLAGYNTTYEPSNEVDEFTGAPVSIIEKNEPVYEERLIKDQFQLEVLDPRNVIVDPKYAYSLQQKRYVIVREELSPQDLEERAEAAGYFNLDLIDPKTAPDETETSKETYNQDDQLQHTPLPDDGAFDVLTRYGKFWVVVDDEGEYSPGLDDEGNVVDGAELKPCRVTVVLAGGKSVLIGFSPNPYKDAMGRSYIPIIRPLCYIHPTKDGGLGDGPAAYGLQTAIDDSANASFDRTMLGTFPMLKYRQGSVEDTGSLFFAPGHSISTMNDPDNDVREMKIDDNSVAAMNTIGMLTQ
ncbi:MAG: hypothetical protein KKB59_20140, partial [Spirochaetes bacterium]|nr:hypothetical protein [Spirochaetota bacterium]